MTVRHILVVDDDASLRDAFALALSGHEHCLVATAADGPAGLKSAAATRPDLVFLDLKMPGMSGVEVLRELLSADPSLTVYIITAFEPEFIEDLRAARQDGLSFEVLRKPIGIAELRTVARDLLGADAAPSEPQQSGA